MTENELASRVIGLAIEVHKLLGPGLLESVYKQSLYSKIKQAGFDVEMEKTLPMLFEDIELQKAYKIDLLVENKLVIELKCVEQLHNVHFAQTLTYLKLGQYKLGLLMNFNVYKLRDGIKAYC